MRRASPSPAVEAAATPAILLLRGHGELPRLLTLTAASPEAPAWPADAWVSYLAGTDEPGDASRRLFAKASAQGDLCGILAITLVEGCTELELLLVHPESRRQGVGRALARHWLEWARHAGATEAVLEVRASNAAAQELYIELGFRGEGYRPRYYQRPEEDALLMRKDLSLGRGERGQARQDRKV